MLSFAGTFVFVATSAPAADVGPAFYGDPPDEHHAWAVHDRNRPLPKPVTPGTFSTPDQPGKPPADAVVLFDGTDLSAWVTGRGQPAKWIVKDGYMQVNGGEIRTRREFGDCQVHVEWAAPAEVKGGGQGRGNSGVFLPGGLEIQVLDSYDNPTYADGGAGAYYGIHPPLVNALRPPGEYQVYDIVFRRPVYRDGQVLDWGYVTVFVNGVLVQDHTPLEGSGGHMGRTRPGPFPEKGSLRLQDHGHPIRFRNIWCRELPPRTSQGGTDGYLTPEAAMAKRREIAASIRADADTLKDPANPVPELLRRMESLVYESDPATLAAVDRLNAQYLQQIRTLPPAKLAQKQGELKHLRDVFRYLARWKILPATYGPRTDIDQIIRDQGWDKRKKG